MINGDFFIRDKNLIDRFIDQFNIFACNLDWDLPYHDLKYLLNEFFNIEVK